MIIQHSNLTNIIKIAGFPGGSVSKESACNAGDLSLISGSRKSPREGNGNSLLHSCLVNSMDRRTWWATYSPWGHKSQMRPSY